MSEWSGKPQFQELYLSLGSCSPCRTNDTSSLHRSKCILNIDEIEVFYSMSEVSFHAESTKKVPQGLNTSFMKKNPVRCFRKVSPPRKLTFHSWRNCINSRPEINLWEVHLYAPHFFLADPNVFQQWQVSQSWLMTAESLMRLLPPDTSFSSSCLISEDWASF